MTINSDHPAMNQVSTSLPGILRSLEPGLQNDAFERLVGHMETLNHLMPVTSHFQQQVSDSTLLSSRQYHHISMHEYRMCETVPFFLPGTHLDFHMTNSL